MLFIALVVSGIPANAQVYKYSGEFLNIGIGARSLAMGNAVVASTNDATAAFWNPAGLLGLERQYQLDLMHAEYFAGIANFDYIGGAVKLDDQSAAGFSAIRLGVDDIPNTLELIDNEGNVRYDRISSFSVADYAFIGTYARALPVDGLAVGGNVKLIYRKTGDFANAWGFGLDAGATYVTNKWKFGAAYKDVTSTFTAWSFNNEQLEEVFLVTGNDLPENSVEVTLPHLQLGAGREFTINEKFNAYTELDLDITFDGKRNVLVSFKPLSIDPHLGGEICYMNLVFLRAGISNAQFIQDFDDKRPVNLQPNFGIGVHYRNFTIDYALTDITKSVALYSNIFSLSYSFDYQKQDLNR